MRFLTISNINRKFILIGLIVNYWLLHYGLAQRERILAICGLLFHLNYRFSVSVSSIICSYLAHFLSPSSINRKNLPGKKIPLFWEMKLSCSSIKNFLYFLKRKIFLYFKNGDPKKIPYISGNGAFLYFRELLLFQEVTFQTRKMKKTHP